MSTKPILDDLFGLLSPEVKAALSAEFAKNAKAKEMVEQGLTFRAAYLEGDETDAKTPEQLAAEKAEADRIERERVERERIERARVAAAGASGNGASAELKALTDQLTALNNTITEKFKNVITRDQLPTLEGQVLEKAIVNASMVMEMKAHHKATFGEDLDLAKLNTYLEEQKKSGRSFGNIRAVYDDMMREKVIEKKIAEGIAEGIKQKKSADAVVGQASPAAVNPLTEAMRKLRGEQTNVNDYAEKLRKIREAREGTGEGAAA
jgi:hypothetical protein